MVKYKKILSLLLFVGAGFTANAAQMDFPACNSVYEQQQNNTMSFDLRINGTTTVKMENVPTSGYLEVYSILGVKVTSVNLRTCVGGRDIELPKGLYILKAGKVALKVIVR